jgi:lipoprotein-anchoring transpeptidase ErfK/SrfK
MTLAELTALWREPNAIDKLAEELGQGDKDTLHRIHGTNEPWTIGTSVSSGCIRLTNDDITDFYNRTSVGTKVAVLAAVAPTAMR